MSKRMRIDEDGDGLNSSERTTRPRRGTTNQPPPTTIERSSPDERRATSIRITVKADPKKLQKATSGKVSVNSRDSFQGGEIVNGPRASRKKTVVEESSEEEDEDDEDEDAEGEGEDEDEDEVDDDEEEEEEEDAEGEDDEDELMADAIPIPPKIQPWNLAMKPSITVSEPKDLPSVEDKEMAMDDDEDEELSELDEDEDLEGMDAMGGDDAGPDSDEDISRSQTPDPSKLTRRQRGDHELMALSNEAQKKKHLSAEEISMRRTEMARRRKNLSEKRNEEEKMDTINRLLKKQAPKRQRKADVEADRIAEEGEAEPARPNKVFVRYVQNVKGSVLGVPEEWVDARYVGGLFGREGEKPKGMSKGWSGRMVEVVE